MNGAETSGTARSVAPGHELADKGLEIATWVEGILSEGTPDDEHVAVVLEGASDATATSAAKRGARLFLVALGAVPSAQARTSTVLQFNARYLVTTWAETVAAAHQLLADLIFAAMADAAFEVDLSAPAPEIWTALGLRPQPTFVLQTTVWRSRATRAVKRVRHPLVTNMVTAVPFHGQVVGPGAYPLAGALVQLPVLSQSTVTDARGCFTFPRVPAEPRTQVFIVQAKGDSQTIAADRSDDADTVSQLQFQLKED